MEKALQARTRGRAARLKKMRESLKVGRGQRQPAQHQQQGQGHTSPVHRASAIAQFQRDDTHLLILVPYDKASQCGTSKRNSKMHGPITSSDQTVPTQIRICDWSMLFGFAFARNTLTRFVIVFLKLLSSTMGFRVLQLVW